MTRPEIFPAPRAVIERERSTPRGRQPVLVVLCSARPRGGEYLPRSIAQRWSDLEA